MKESLGLRTDLYELTMAAGYFQNKTNLRATFELYCHTMPPNRTYLLSCGLEQVIEYILNLRFSDSDINYLKSLAVFREVSPSFFKFLKGFKFSGDVWALEEGEIFFAGEPILQIEAPIIEAQILETYILSVFNIQTLVATKAARVIQSACLDGVARQVIDFGARRAHGPDAAILAARAAYIGGCVGTSNVYAGMKFGIPTLGTMAHSWIQAFEQEQEAFLKYQEVFPANTIFLVDTYDTLEGVKKAIALHKNFNGVRLDSGNILALSRRVRKLLDQSGLRHVKIIASGDLNEYKIEDLVLCKAPVDIFGVGTQMVVSRDCPALDLTYKLVQTTDMQGRIRLRSKKSQGKQTVPGRKQIFRNFDRNGMMQQDLVGLFYERPLKGFRPLMKSIVKKGRIIKSNPGLETIRRNAKMKLAKLPSQFHGLNKKSSYPVTYSAILHKLKGS